VVAVSLAIERLLTRPLSARIVEDAFVPGDTIVAEADDDHLKFESQSSPVA
jgi:hypothetical protein